MTKHLVFIEVKAQKQLKKAPKRDKERIIEVLNTLEKKGCQLGLISKSFEVIKGIFG